MVRKKVGKTVLIILPFALFGVILFFKNMIIKEYVGEFDVSAGGWTKAEPAALIAISKNLRAHPRATKIVSSYDISLGTLLLPARIEYFPSTEKLTFYTDNKKVINCTQVTSQIINDISNHGWPMTAITSPHTQAWNYDCQCDDIK